MKLLELKIENIRGIPELALEPKGKNMVIWGPNGSGKSGVVDALDFLLSGHISRLTGKGTGDISLSKHGPHIDQSPDSALVVGKMYIPGSEKPVKISRKLSQPNKLICDADITPRLRSIFDTAARGQHVLTRRDILKYITADASTRAQEIQDLLDISDIEDFRKTLVKVQNACDKDVKAAKQAQGVAIGNLNATAQIKTFNRDHTLKVINENRASLGGTPISGLRSDEVKQGINRPTLVASTQQGTNPKLLEKDIQNISSVLLKENQSKILQTDEQLRTLISHIQADSDLLGSLQRYELAQLGLNLLDDSGSCPLCDTPWPPGELLAYLQAKLSKAKKAKELKNQINQHANLIASHANTTVASLRRVTEAARNVEAKSDLPLLETWVNDLQILTGALADPINKYLQVSPDPKKVHCLLAPQNLSATLGNILSIAQSKCPQVTPEQTAWETLIRFEENIKATQQATSLLKMAVLSHNRATLLLNSYLNARDKVLEKLYDDIKDRFVEIYRKLHISDEGEFTAIIAPQEAGLNFQVDFYGRGNHPPHALHSEGHQDSMGICLYLALAERLTQGLVDMVILDDVLMSVDTEHRRHICRLLAEVFPDRQFLITTHDKTWANQLKTEGVVNSKQSIEFYNWHIDTGPYVNFETDIWDRITQDIERNDISAASARLRRGSEDLFSLICDSLRAPVTFKLNGRWELGDLMPTAIGHYGSLLRKAKKTAQSWEDKETFHLLQELESTLGQTYSRTNAEQWAVNATVHYNNWANLGKEDFEPVVDAFRDLYPMFACPNCGGILYVTTKGVKLEAIRCNCGSISWNLVDKEK